MLYLANNVIGRAKWTEKCHLVPLSIWHHHLHRLTSLQLDKIKLEHHHILSAWTTLVWLDFYQIHWQKALRKWLQVILKISHQISSQYYFNQTRVFITLNHKPQIITLMIIFKKMNIDTIFKNRYLDDRLNNAKNHL